jgi:hypothetical protein
MQWFPKYAAGGIRDQLAADPLMYFANGYFEISYS